MARLKGDARIEIGDIINIDDCWFKCITKEMHHDKYIKRMAYENISDNYDKTKIPFMYNFRNYNKKYNRIFKFDNNVTLIQYFSNKDQVISKEEWYHNDKLHRLDGPAVLVYNWKGGKILGQTEKYYNNGMLVESKYVRDEEIIDEQV